MKKATIDKTSVWKLVTIIFSLVAIASLGYYGWVERKPILQKVTGKKLNTDVSRTPNPGEETKQEMIKFANGYDWIMGVNIIKVNFRLNTRSTTFRFFKEPEVTNAWNTYAINMGPAPLFTNNEIRNQRLVNLINGQFACVGVMETSAGQLIPAVSKYTTHVCMVPIPPGYGDFIGFINIFLRREPTPAEVQDLEKQGMKMSIDMYERDIVKSQRNFQFGR